MLLTVLMIALLIGFYALFAGLVVFSERVIAPHTVAMPVRDHKRTS
jgi:hypothetical protein